MVSARAAWDPKPEIESVEEAYKLHLEDIFKNVFDDPEVVDIISDYSLSQKELLIYGKLPKKKKGPKRVTRRNGQAYLQGWESWDDVNNFISSIPFVGSLKTQPDRHSPKWVKRSENYDRYWWRVRPLLKAMAKQFRSFASEFDMLASSRSYANEPLFNEFHDGFHITALRAEQMYTLYEGGVMPSSTMLEKKRQRKVWYKAHQILKQAKTIVQNRQENYRLEHVSDWGTNATAYNYGYLWTVKSLLYWYRTEDKFIYRDKTCAFNIIDPAQIISYEGRESSLFKKLLGLVKDIPFLGFLRRCTDDPNQEPKYKTRVKESWK